MRIGITCYPTYGGSGAVATELGLELARRGHDVHFISYASPFRLRGFAERVTFHEVTQFDYPLFEQSSPYALALAVKQHEVAKREQLDLMHVHYAIPHSASAEAVIDASAFTKIEPKRSASAASKRLPSKRSTR